MTVCIMAMPVIVLNSLERSAQHAVFAGRNGTVLSGHARARSSAKIILPAASPMIFAGLRLGCAAGFIGVILAELLITPTGIGDIISYNQSIAEYPKMYAAILVDHSVCRSLFIEVLERIESHPVSSGDARGMSAQLSVHRKQ